MDRDEFFAVLDQLTLSQIEARIPLWDGEQLKLVGEYLEQRKGQGAPPPPQTAAESPAAIAMATRANKMATIALIVAIGAMLAAIVSGLAAIEALP